MPSAFLADLGDRSRDRRDPPSPHIRPPKATQTSGTSKGFFANATALRMVTTTHTVSAAATLLRRNSRIRLPKEHPRHVTG
jgi:hypothetical protein